jgi:hypothetical protein
MGWLNERKFYRAPDHATPLAHDRARSGPRELLLPRAILASVSEDELSVLERRVDSGGGGRGRVVRGDGGGGHPLHWEAA